MATTKEEGAVPDFLRMDQPVSSDPANAKKTGNWHGWPTKDINPVTLTDDEGRTVRIRTPVMDLEGLITPTSLHYTVQHFAVPPVVESAAWELKIFGEVKDSLTLNFDQLRRFPGRSVRTVMECSGSDATFFEYFKGEGPKPSRTQEGMILSASEWTGVPLAAVLHEAGLTANRSTCGPRATTSVCRRRPPRAPNPSITTRVCQSKRRFTLTPF
jgi:DMSO/TMAO reductase YedYZ molybdopterin-dependent catalytic subunit